MVTCQEEIRGSIGRVLKAVRANDADAVGGAGAN
jgi:hypothetical protein